MPVYTFAELNEHEIVSGYHARFVHSDNNTFARWRIEKDSLLPEHSHPHEQTSILLEGEFELTVDGQTHRLSPGKLVVVPADVPHSGRALTDCVILDTFYPVRQDYRERG